MELLLNSFCQTCVRLLLSLALLISGIFLPFLLLFLLILRKTVYLLAKIFRPDLKNFVESASVIFAQENILKKPKFNEVVIFISDGLVELEDFRAIFHERLILKKKEPKGELYYPELKQYWTSYLSYLFWKDEEGFDLKNHVRLYDYGKNVNSEKCAGNLKLPDIEEGDFCDEDDLRRVMAPLLEMPWREKTSPWEMLLVQNFKSKELPPQNMKSNCRPATIGIFRFHHAMADGYSLSKLLLRDLMQVELENKVNFPKLGFLEKFWLTVVIPFKLPWDLAGNLIQGIDGTNCWHGWGKEHKFSRQFCTSISAPIDTQLVKDIKNKYGVGYNAVLCAAVAGGCQRVMEEGKQVVPDQMTCVVPVPLPRHPNGLVNHVTIHFMKWPMGGNCSREHRLRTISERMTHSKFYTGPLGFHLLTHIGIIAPFLSKLRCLIPCTVMLSSFPGPEGPRPVKGLGVNVVDIIGGISPGSGSVGTSMLLISSNGKQRFTVTIDKTIFPAGQQVFENLGRYIEDELLILSKIDNKFAVVTV